MQCVEPVFIMGAENPDLKSPKNQAKNAVSGHPGSPMRQIINSVKITPPTDFDEVWEFFTRQDMSHVMVNIYKNCLFIWLLLVAFNE